jgi:predicted RNA-binding Zn ribbon-like protein
MTTLQNKSKPIRRGGIATPAGYLYELSGGELCLDFANTVDSRPTEEPRELLSDYSNLVQWSAQAGAITPRAAKRLDREADRQRGLATAVLRRARTLREAIFRVFSAVAFGTTPPNAALDVLNRHLPAVLKHLRVMRDGADYRWEWEREDALDHMLWPVLRSAAELLTSDRLDRVRVCSADDCDWLFLDQSKNRTRRWCDMTVCGNRNKVRQFRRAQRRS